jgi:hypothetical protein
MRYEIISRGRNLKIRKITAFAVNSHWRTFRAGLSGVTSITADINPLMLSKVEA